MTDYDFRQLSGYDLEKLVRDLLQAEWKIVLESFAAGRDKGIDLRYAKKGRTIVQCKHYVGSGFRKLMSDLEKKEMPKIRALTPKRYVLATSLQLTPDNKEKLSALLHPFLKGPHDIFGANDINNLLGLHADVETRHFKLWLSSTAVLRRVLHNAEQCQTEFDVERVVRRLPLYVQTNALRRAWRILGNTNVVIISGIPGIGKTTLADLLLYAHLEQGYEPAIIRNDVNEGKRIYKKGRKQVFYFDDFLGQTFLGERRGLFSRNQDVELLDFIEMIGRSANAKLVMTTREHLLQNALLSSERLKHSMVLDHRYILTLSDYTFGQKAEILYNHIYFSELPRAYRRQLISNRFYMNMLNHRNFTPRLVEWLSSYNRVRSTPAKNYSTYVSSVLDNPGEIWAFAFSNQISDAGRDLLLCLFALGGEESGENLLSYFNAMREHTCRRYNRPMQSNEFRSALQELEGGFLTIRNFFGLHIDFINPSVKDFLTGEVLGNHEHIEDLLAAAPRFEPILRLWELILTNSGAVLLRIFRKRPLFMANAISRVALLPWYRQRRSRGGGWSRELIDITPEIRLATVVKLAERLDSAEIAELIQPIYDAVITKWGEGSIDIDDSVQMLQALQTGKSTSALYCSAKSEILNEAKKLDSCRELTILENYRGWTPKERSDLATIFDDYMDSKFSEERESCGTSGELEVLQTNILKLGNNFERDVDAQIESLDDVIVERKEQEEREDEDEGDSGDPGEYERMQSDHLADLERIHAMFDSLRQ